MQILSITMGGVSEFCVLAVAILLKMIETASNSTTKGMARTTILNLIFLKDFERSVATYGARKLDDAQKEDFMDTWSEVLGDEIATDTLKRLELYWTYTLSLVRQHRNVDLTTLVVTLYIKILALLNGTSYLACVMYHKKVYAGYSPEHCRILAANLIIFSNIGTSNMVDTILRNWRHEIVPDTVNYIEGFATESDIIKHHCGTHLMFETHQQHVHSPTQEETISKSIKLYWDLIDYDIGLYQNGFVPGPRNLRYLEPLLNAIIYGTYDSIIQHRGSLTYLYTGEREVPLWYKSVDIYEKLKRGLLGGTHNKIKYSLTNAILEMIVHRVQILGVERHIYIEDFENMIPNRLEIVINGWKFLHNVELDIDEIHIV